MKRIRNGRNSWRRILFYFRRYVVVVLLLALSFLPIYLVSYQSIRSSAIQNTTERIRAGIVYLDTTYDKLITLGDACSVQSDMLQVSQMTTPLKSSQYSNLLSAQRYLQSVFLRDNLVNSLYLIFRDNPILISRGFVCTDTNSMYQKFYWFGQDSYEQWRAAMLDKGEPVYFLPAVQTNTVFEPEGTRVLTRCVHMVLPLPTKEYRQKSGAMVFAIDEAQLLSLFGGTQGFTYLANREGAIVASRDYNGDALQNIAEGVNSVTVAGTPTTVLSLRSARTGLTVVYGIPDHVFASQVRSTLVLMQVFLAVGVLVTLLLSIVLAFQDTRPMVRLVQQAEEITNIRPILAKLSGEWEFVSSALTTLSAEIARNRSFIASNTVSGLLHGRLYLEEDLAVARSLLGEGGPYLACRIEVQRQTDEDSEEHLDRLSRVLLHLREHLNQALPGWLRFVLSAPNATLVLCPGTAENPLQQLLEALANALGDLPAELASTAYAGVGTPVADLPALSHSYKNAVYAMRFCDHTNPIVSYASVSAGSRKIVMDTGFFQRLRDIIVAGDKVELNRLFEEKVRYIFRQECHSEVELAQNFYRIRGTLFNIVNDFIPDRATALLPEYSPTMTIDGLIQSMYDTCEGIIDGIVAARSNRRNETRQSILRFIQENYRDSNLSALLIAERFTISEKYVFNLIKEETGKTLGDYMEDVRFAKAEELLQSGVSVNRVPELVGYNSINTFYKAFKRRYGVSPKAWCTGEKTD